MNFVSWNVRHGGAKSKVGGICEQLATWEPDVVGLSEYRDSETSKAIASKLHELGMVHQLSTSAAPERGVNFLLLASRYPMEVQRAEGLLHGSGRWLHATTNGVHVIAMHVPNRSDAKWQFHDEVVERMRELRSERVVCFGDTNTGRPGIDEENPFFNRRESSWFDQIEEAGWVDVWRSRNPSAREFTWYSTSNNGFRLDQVFAPKEFAHALSEVCHDWGTGGRSAGLSDHAAIAFKLNVV